MKNTVLIVFLIFILSACSNEDNLLNETSVNQQEHFSTNPEGAMRIKTLDVQFTKAEDKFHQKILRLASNEFDDKHQNQTQEDLEEFAISFLIEESENLLLENGYDQNQIKFDFEGDNIKLIHQALKIYGDKINSNQ